MRIRDFIIALLMFGFIPVIFLTDACPPPWDEYFMGTGSSVHPNLATAYSKAWDEAEEISEDCPPPGFAVFEESCTVVWCGSMRCYFYQVDVFCCYL